MKNIRNIFTLVLIVGFVILTQGCGTTPEMWASVLEGVNSGLAAGYSGNTSSYNTSSSSTLLTISNRTGYDAWYVYASPSTDNNWGADRLGSDILYDGQSTTIYLPRQGSYDIRLKDSDGDTYTKYSVYITSGSTVTFYFSDYD